MRKCPRCNQWELDVTGEEVELKGNFLFRCWNCGYECDLIEAEKNNYPSEAMEITDLDKKGQRK